jgi:protein phosphatase
MGTTVSGIIRVGDKVAMAHIGDSRIYRFRDGQLEQISSDHTFVQRLVDSGRITPEEAAVHPRRSVLMRVLGMSMRPPRSTPPSTTCRPAIAGCSAPTVSAATCPRTRSASILDTVRTAQGRRRPPRQGEPRSRRARQRHRRDPRHRRRPGMSGGDPTFVGSAAAPLSFESDTSRRPIRLPTLLLHPLKASQPEDSHFEPEREGYLEELIEEDRRRARRRRIVWLVVVAAAVLAIIAGLFAAYQWTSRTTTSASTTARSRSSRACSRTSGPIGLSSVYQTTTIEVSSLPSFQQESVRRPSTPTTSATRSTSSTGSTSWQGDDVTAVEASTALHRHRDDPGAPASAGPPPNIELVLLLFAIGIAGRRSPWSSWRPRTASARRCCYSAPC